MEALAAKQPGYLDFESSREGDIGISISYWRDADAIAAWKNHAEHLLTQRQGREQWYRSYQVQVAQVQRSYSFDKVHEK